MTSDHPRLPRRPHTPSRNVLCASSSPSCWQAAARRSSCTAGRTTVCASPPTASSFSRNRGPGPMTARTLRAAAFVLIGAITMSNLAPAGARAEVPIKDASGRDVKVADTSRIVAIGGDVTEILYALKADAKIAAVDSTSQFPVQALKEKPNVGYMR